jgi:hypothetical protein
MQCMHTLQLGGNCSDSVRQITAALYIDWLDCLYVTVTTGVLRCVARYFS